MNARKQAWETRRKKYGPCGHNGLAGYNRIRESHRLKIMEAALIKLHIEGVLSEGQAAKMTGLDRIQVRIRADAMEKTDG